MSDTMVQTEDEKVLAQLAEAGTFLKAEELMVMAAAHAAAAGKEATAVMAVCSTTHYCVVIPS
ncbi:MAG TPA: hypothetical protein VMU51_03205 [Mycobacteriales bacterium]|jgi:hypothetical protein|nr:hypothetical protein [Mycobacteriales bacterium]